jgi:hypothetical protein
MREIQDNQASRDGFRYSLNAFLAAFRSVTDRVMLMEYQCATDTQGTSGFKAWLEKEWSLLKQDVEINFLVTARNVTIHEEPVRPRAVYEEHLVQTIRFGCSVGYTLIKGDGTVEQGENTDVPAPRSNREPTEACSSTKYYFASLPPENDKRKKPPPLPPADDVVTVCARSLSTLEEFVARAEARFVL